MNAKFPFSAEDERRETIVVPGIGDASQFIRQKSFVEWLNNARPNTSLLHIFDPKWPTNEPAIEKRGRLLEFIAMHPEARNGYAISGGAGLLMSCTIELPRDFSTTFVSGYLQNPYSVNQERREKAPALFDVVSMSEEFIRSGGYSNSVECHAGYLDGVLQQEDMRLHDRPFYRIPMIGHVPAIVYAYTKILPKM